jgi:hypothetical protein
MVGAGEAMAARNMHVILGPTSDLIDETTRASGDYFSLQVPSSGRNSAGAWDGRVEMRGTSAGSTGAKAFISGTLPATAQGIVTNFAQYSLTPPVGANFAGGKLVVYAALAGGDIRGNATLDLAVTVTVRDYPWRAQGNGQRTIGDQAGSDGVEIPITIDLPTTLDSTDPPDVDFDIVLKAIANVAPAGGSAQTAIADGASAASLAGFRVLNAAGVQVAGFTLKSYSGGYSIPERAPPPAGIARAVEYYDAAFGTFFITANANEIAALDSGTTPGWQRTGESFNVFTTSDTGRVGVCRFFGEFVVQGRHESSHFYAPRGLGCEAVLGSPVWKYEGDVFFSPLPAADGTCPSGSIPVFRLYNNGKGGMPNHRFTTSESTMLDMLRDGYVAEGVGAGVGMCSPK